jgi:methyl-accepting chemotaxis protein
MEIVATKKSERKKAFRDIRKRADKAMNYAIVVYFLFSVLLSFFYDTWFMSLSVGTLLLVAYYLPKYLLPNSDLHRYILSGVFAIFPALYIYQMHGLFELHFTFFIGSSLLITYRNWKFIIPLLLVTVVHHALFSWLQYSGMREIYFSQLEYMDLTAFIFHVGLAGIIIGICGFWAYDLEKTTYREILNKGQLEQQLNNVKNNITFAEHISNGDYDTDFKLLDEEDDLGKSLIKMRDNLRIANQREKEDRFITVGITKIGDIIREHGSDMKALTDAFIRGLIKYVDVNQGGLFVREDQEDGSIALKLKACYAYDRKKYLQKSISPGEGLVGQCYLEGEEIYMTRVPQDYVQITSGLGTASPGCICIVPVKTQDETVGVIELASFRELRDYEKQFIHRAAENMAAAIITSRTTQHIKQLLEESQQRAEEFQSQEEEVRQNMEELSATQEEMARKAIESESRLEAIEQSGIISVELTMSGEFVSANRHFLQVFGYSLDELMSVTHDKILAPQDRNSEENKELWDNLRYGVSKSGDFKFVSHGGNTLYMRGSYSILRNQHGNGNRVLLLCTDVTREKFLERELVAN